MNGASGFQEARSSTSRSSAHRLLREQRYLFGTASWHRLRTHNLAACSIGICTKQEKVPDTILMPRRLFFLRRLYLFSSAFFALLIALFLFPFGSSTSALGQEVSVLGVEITQAIQAMNASDTSLNNTVPLFKNKHTLVRVYFDTSLHYASTIFRGSLYIAPKNGPGVYASSLWPQVFARPNKNERQGLVERLDFYVPDTALTGDGLVVGPLVLIPSSIVISTGSNSFYITTPPLPVCKKCDFTITKRLYDSPPLRVKLIGVEYMVDGQTYNTLPSPAIGSHVTSWLSRAYPVSPDSLSVDYVQPPFVFDVNAMSESPPPRYHQATCSTTNYFIRNIVREREVNGDPDNQGDDLPPDHPLRHTHYMGVVYDGTDHSTNPETLAPLFKAGCSDQGLLNSQLPPPTLEHFFMKVGSFPSGPTGPPQYHPWYHKPPWYGDLGDGGTGYWDDDGEYGDWYVGHELGHLLGLQHVNNAQVDQTGWPNSERVCSRVDETPPLDYPFPNGQLAGPDGTYAGFDSDSQYGMRSLPGQSWHDIMTYCVRPWLSSRTYGHIACRIYRENGLPCIGSFDIKSDAAFSLEIWHRMKLAEIDLIPIPKIDPPPIQPLLIDPGAEELAQKSNPQSNETVPSKESRVTAALEFTPHLNVLSSINWKGRKGNLQFVTVLHAPGTPTGKVDGRVQIRLTDSDGTKKSFPITSPSNTGVLLDISELQWVEALAPFKPHKPGSIDPRTVMVELVIEGKVVDFLKVGTIAPTLRNITLLPQKPKVPDTQPDLEATSKSRRPLVFTWEVKPPPGDVKISYSVLISLDGALTWQAAALLSQPRFEIPRERLMGAKSVRLRVIASDGFNSTTETSAPLTIPPL